MDICSYLVWLPSLCACADPEIFARGGPTLKTFIFFDEGREDQNSTKRGSSSARQQNAISMAFRWRADDGRFGSFVIFQWIWDSIAKKPYIFVIFSGGGGPDPLSPPPLDPRMMCAIWISTV